VPSSETILTGLIAIANDWRWLAITWHVLLAALLVSLVAGWRPSTRLVGLLLVAPLVSVSVLAWLSGNPFNGTVFALIAAALVGAATRAPNMSIQPVSPAWVVPAVALIAYGGTYPHFLRTESWMTYIYASPFGILPCPTLSVLIGITLLVPNVRSKSWSAALVFAGLLYGAVGVFTLGVLLDSGLILASGVLAAAVWRDHPGWRSVRADRAERTRLLVGDDFIREPLGTLTHAITLGRPPQAVWPWLIQMGAGSRAGWYSYDVLDNGRQPSATRLVPALQHITIGSVFPALPGATEGFVVLAFEPYRSLILGWPSPDGPPLVTWSFVLEERAGHSTRLIVRARGGQDYRFHGLPSWVSLPIVRLVHFVMQRKQLLGIARRVESSSVPTTPETASASGFRSHVA
jgi:hypothetical protein